MPWICKNCGFGNNQEHHASCISCGKNKLYDEKDNMAIKMLSKLPTNDKVITSKDIRNKSHERMIARVGHNEVNRPSVISGITFSLAAIIFFSLVHPGSELEKTNWWIAWLGMISIPLLLLTSLITSIWGAYYCDNSRYKRISHFVVILFFLTSLGVIRKMVFGR